MLSINHCAGVFCVPFWGCCCYKFRGRQLPVNTVLERPVIAWINQLRSYFMHSFVPTNNVFFCKLQASLCCCLLMLLLLQSGSRTAVRMMIKRAIADELCVISYTIICNAYRHMKRRRVIKSWTQSVILCSLLLQKFVMNVLCSSSVEFASLAFHLPLRIAILWDDSLSAFWDVHCFLVKTRKIKVLSHVIFV